MKDVHTTLKIKLVVISLVLSFLLIPCYAFADSSGDTSPDLSSKSLSDEFVMASTLQANALQATTYTTTDIYNLLYHCLREGSNSAYGAITEINNNLTYYVSGTNWSIAELAGMTWGKVGNIEDALDYNNTLTSTTNAKLEYVFSAIEDTINIKWYNTTSSYIGTRKTLSGSNLTSTTTSNSFFCGFNVTGVDNPQLVRITFPLYRNGVGQSNVEEFKLNSITAINGSTNYSITLPKNYFFQQTNTTLYLYLFDFSFIQSSSWQYWFNITYPTSFTFNNNASPTIVNIPFDTLDYQIIKNAFYQTKTGEGNDALTKLANVYASDDLIQAKANQQSYENDVISEFTGNGDSASKTSDKNGLKSVSSNIKSGLNTGGSINNALAVFDTSNSLWQFFTTTTENNVDTRSRSNSRSINIRNSNDTILDFQSERDREYYTHLGE